MATLPLTVVGVVLCGWCFLPPVYSVWTRPLPDIRNQRTTFIKNITKVPSPMPRFANNTDISTQDDEGGGDGDGDGDGGEGRIIGMVGQTMNNLVPLTQCGSTNRLDDGQAILLFSRHDIYRYECNQTFEAVNMDGLVNLTCHHLALKINCFTESLTITTDGNNKTYCLQDKVPVHSGKKISVYYQRRTGVVNGGFVCTISAHTPISTAKMRLCANCGLSQAMEKEAKSLSVLRVVGGTIANKDEYPWAVFLVMVMSNSKYRCGGSLITDTLIISAAHCFAGYSIQSIQVGVGQVDITVSGEVGAQWYTTNNYEIHPQYDDQTFENDLALIILDRPVPFTQSVRPLCLPSTDLPMEGHNAMAMGWGALSYGGPLSNTLQEVQLLVWSNADCQTAWRNKFGESNFEIVASQVCAGTNGRDTCNGDSGGPLMVKVGGRWELLGVTSYGYKCAEEGMAGVYTRISKYTNWIEKFIPITYCQENQ